MFANFTVFGDVGWFVHVAGPLTSVTIPLNPLVPVLASSLILSVVAWPEAFTALTVPTTTQLDGKFPGGSPGRGYGALTLPVPTMLLFVPVVSLSVKL